MRTKLITGDHLKGSILSAIEESQFLVAFLSRSAARSEWVRRELEWARQRQERLARPFILPVVIEENAIDLVEPESLRNALESPLHRELVSHDECHVRELAQAWGVT